MSAPQSDSPSTRGALAWALFLIVPNLFFFAWLFHAVNPVAVAGNLYSFSDEIPAVCRLPAAFLLVAAAGLFLRWKRPDMVALLSRMLFSARGVAIFFAVLALFCSLSLGVGFLVNLLRASWGVAVLSCAVGLGLRILQGPILGFKPTHFESPLERLVLSAALGLGALSLGVFLAGSGGVMNSWVWRILILSLCAINFRLTRALGSDVCAALQKSSNQNAPIVIAAAIFGALFLFSHAPLIWNLPLEYDVLEYHLAAPAEYMRGGSIRFLSENIYATFPENGEMLFLLSMLLCGEKISALPSAHVIVLATWMLSIVGVYALARRLERSLVVPPERMASPAPIAAALLFMLVPLGSQLAADFYVEHFQTLFHVAALLCGCAFLSDFKIQQLFKLHALNNAAGWLLCAGALCGLACGAKYTALLFTLLPLLIFLPGYCAWNGAFVEAFSALLRLGIPALAVFAPWTIRNWIASGDPLHPLGLVMRRRMAVASELPDRLDHFDAAHHAGEKTLRAFGRALQQLMPGFRNSYLDDIESGPQMCFFAVPGIASVVNAETALVAFVFAADLAAWFFFSHRLNRFFYPHLTALAALSGLGLARVWRIKPLRKVAAVLCCVAALLFAPLQLEWVPLYSSREGLAGNLSLLETAHAQFDGKPPLALVGPVNQWDLPPGSGVLFVGEAQTFYCAQTPSYSVVFNRSLLEEALHQTQTTAATLAYLRAHGITHIYFNFGEWFRLDTTYALTFSDVSKQWVLVHWENEAGLTEQHGRMKAALRDRRFVEYTASWPEKVFPAYLKLTLSEYQRLEDIYENHSRQIWPDHAFSLELRELY